LTALPEGLLEAAFARHNELHNGTGEMQPDHT
jgi:hypothetical protein